MPSMTIADENAETFAEICRRLDGLPLAIELAAPRLRVLSPWALLALLDERLRLLSGGYRDAPARHQTMQSAIAWSYELLSPNEQSSFAVSPFLWADSTLRRSRQSLIVIWSRHHFCWIDSSSRAWFNALKR